MLADPNHEEDVYEQIVSQQEKEISKYEVYYLIYFNFNL